MTHQIHKFHSTFFIVILFLTILSLSCVLSLEINEESSIIAEETTDVIETSTGSSDLIEKDEDDEENNNDNISFWGFALDIVESVITNWYSGNNTSHQGKIYQLLV